MAPDRRNFDRLLAGEHHDPHSILGAHEYRDHTVIRAYRPHAVEVVALIGKDRFPLRHLEGGLFAVAVPFVNLVDYRLEVSYQGADGALDVHTVADAYRFLPTLGEMDLHLFSEGRHEQLWEILGAHPRTFNTPDGDVHGVSFAVWAPNAKGVSLIGNFNDWDGNEAQLRVLGSTGVWELFWPGFEVGGLYKFRVHGADGVVTDRADPFAFATEVPPQTASKVTTSDYQWRDEDWMTQRAEQEPGVRADEHLRGAPGVMAARAELPPARSRTHRIRSVTRVHPRRDASGRRAPVRRIVGVSGHVVLRADVAAGHSRRLQGTGRRAAPGGDRRDRGLGARPLPEGRLGAGPLRRNSALRALRPSPR